MQGTTSNKVIKPHMVIVIIGVLGSHSPTVLTPSTVKLAPGVPPLNIPELSPPQIISSPPAYHLDQNTT